MKSVLSFCPRLASLSVLLGVFLAVPEVTAQLTQTNAFLGETIILTGPASSAGLSNYIWFRRESQDLPGGRFIAAPNSAGVPCLVIKNCGSEDTGRYELWSGTTPLWSWEVTVVTPIQEARTLYVGEWIELFGRSGVQNYQWLKNGEAIVGANSEKLWLTGLQIGDSGEYTLLSGFDPVRTNAQWRIEVIEVPKPPLIVDFHCLYSGDNVTFEVFASGTPELQYQWYWQGQPIEGATASTLTFTNAARSANAGYYSVLVFNDAGAIWTPPPGLLFTKAIVPGTYQGVFDGGDFSTAGFFTFTVAETKRSYSGSVIIGNRKYPFSGKFSKDHSASKFFSGASGPTAIDLQLVSADSKPGVMGRMYFGEASVGCNGYRAAYKCGNAAPQAGKYTLALVNTNLTPFGAGPEGNGFASVLVTRSGNVGINGMTADGAPFTYSRALLSKDGRWPLYVPLYKNRGYLVGWSSFNSAQTNLPVEVTWMKEGFDSKFYPYGFSLSLTPIVSTFTTVEIPRDLRSPITAPWIPFSSGTVSFTGGDMFGDELVWNFVPVLVSGPATVEAKTGPDKLNFKINNNGIITGTFINPEGQTVSTKGILLQQQGIGLGYFLHRNLSGYFCLEGTQ